MQRVGDSTHLESLCVCEGVWLCIMKEAGMKICGLLERHDVGRDFFLGR